MERLEPDLVAGRRDVEVLEDALHPPDVLAGVGEDEEVPGRVGDDARVAGRELPEDVGGDVLGVHVVKTEHARHVALFAGRRLARTRDGGGLLGDVLGVDDLPEGAARDHGEPVRLQHREEGLVRLGDGDLLRGVERRLEPLRVRRGDDETATGELADRANEIGEVGVVEGESDFVVGCLRGEGELGMIAGEGGAFSGAASTAGARGAVVTGTTVGVATRGARAGGGAAPESALANRPTAETDVTRPRKTSERAERGLTTARTGAREALFRQR